MFTEVLYTSLGMLMKILSVRNSVYFKQRVYHKDRVLNNITSQHLLNYQTLIMRAKFQGNCFLGDCQKRFVILLFLEYSRGYCKNKSFLVRLSDLLMGTSIAIVKMHSQHSHSSFRYSNTIIKTLEPGKKYVQS